MPLRQEPVSMLHGMSVRVNIVNLLKIYQYQTNNARFVYVSHKKCNLFEPERVSRDAKLTPGARGCAAKLLVTTLLLNTEDRFFNSCIPASACLNLVGS